ncbi:MAG: hypothetical protein AB8B79_03200 [Granulosicoccus sp.]
MAMNPDKSSAKQADSIAPLARHLLWVDSAEGVQRLVRVLAGLCIFLFLMDFFWHRHTKVPGEGFYGFHAIAGFVSFTVIVLGARLLRLVIRRYEDYYAPNGVDSEPYPEQGTERIAHDHRSSDSLRTLFDELRGKQTSSASNNSGDTSGGHQP